VRGEEQRIFIALFGGPTLAIGHRLTLSERLRSSRSISSPCPQQSAPAPRQRGFATPSEPGNRSVCASRSCATICSQRANDVRIAPKILKHGAHPSQISCSTSSIALLPSITRTRFRLACRQSLIRLVDLTVEFERLPSMRVSLLDPAALRACAAWPSWSPRRYPPAASDRVFRPRQAMRSRAAPSRRPTRARNLVGEVESVNRSASTSRRVRAPAGWLRPHSAPREAKYKSSSAVGLSSWLAASNRMCRIFRPIRGPARLRVSNTFAPARAGAPQAAHWVVLAGTVHALQHEEQAAGGHWELPL